MPWIQQTNFENMTPQWVYFSPDGTPIHVQNTPPTAQDQAKYSDNPRWWETAQRVDVPGTNSGGVINPTTGQVETLGMTIDKNGNNIGLLPKSVADSMGFSAGWNDQPIVPYSGGFLDDIGGNLLPIIASLGAGAVGLPAALGGGLTGQLASGALTSALTGGNPLTGALTGALSSGASSLVPSGSGDFIPFDSSNGGYDLGTGAGSLISPALEQAMGPISTGLPSNAPINLGNSLPALAGIAGLGGAISSPSAGASAGIDLGTGSGSLTSPALEQAMGAPSTGLPSNSQIPLGSIGAAGALAGAASGSSSTTYTPDANGGFGADPNPMPGANSPVSAGSTSLSLLQSLLNSPAALGIGLGGLLGSMNGSSPAGTTTTVQDIPDWQKPYVTSGLDAAKSIFQSNQSNPAATTLNNAGMTNLTNTINGQFLDPATNPYLQATYDKAARSVQDTYNYTTMPQLSRAFGNQQAFGGSSAYGEAFGKANQGLATGLSDLATGIYGQNYQAERGRQFTGALGAPEYANAYTQSPYSNVNSYMNLAGKGYGSQTTQPYFTNPAGGALSGALAGYGLSKVFG